MYMKRKFDSEDGYDSCKDEDDDDDNDGNDEDDDDGIDNDDDDDDENDDDYDDDDDDDDNDYDDCDDDDNDEEEEEDNNTVVSVMVDGAVQKAVLETISVIAEVRYTLMPEDDAAPNKRIGTCVKRQFLTSIENLIFTLLQA